MKLCNLLCVSLCQGVASIPGKNPYASKIIENRIYGDEGFLSYCGDDMGMRVSRQSITTCRQETNPYPLFCCDLFP